MSDLLDVIGIRAALQNHHPHYVYVLCRPLGEPFYVGKGVNFRALQHEADARTTKTLTHKLNAEEWARLFAATKSTLTLWMDRLRKEADKSFPEGVTAFRPEFAVHGKFDRPCPRCGEKVQRIRYADNETNYCARCQTGGKVLADRSLSRLLGKDWPRTLDELEALKRR